jgi:biopolymer transport protein TolR
MPADVESLSAAQRGKIRRLSHPKELAPDEEGGELNIIPFLDIITNVLMFVLATVTVTFTTMIDTQPPRLGGGIRGPTTPTLSLNILILRDGFVISAVGQRIAPGCNGPGAGLAVGMVDKDGRKDYDYKKLSECAQKLKALSDEFKNEKQATIAANADIGYQAVISTIDALRKDDKGNDMFTEIMFGVPK